MKQPSRIREEELGIAEDGDAMFASILWYEGQRAAGKFKDHEGMHVALFGERVVAAAPTLEELGRQLDALGDSINQRRVAIKYVPRFEDFNLYG